MMLFLLRAYLQLFYRVCAELGFKKAEIGSETRDHFKIIPSDTRHGLAYYSRGSFDHPLLDRHSSPVQ